MRIVKIKSNVNAAKGRSGKTQKTRATISLRMYEKGEYIKPSLLETA